MSFYKDNSFKQSDHSLEDIGIINAAIFKKSLSSDQSSNYNASSHSLGSDRKQEKIVAKAVEPSFSAVDQNLQESFESNNRYSFCFAPTNRGQQKSFESTITASNKELLENYRTNSFSYHPYKNEFFPVCQYEAKNQKPHTNTFQQKEPKYIKNQNQIFAPKQTQQTEQNLLPMLKKIVLLSIKPFNFICPQLAKEPKEDKKMIPQQTPNRLSSNNTSTYQQDLNQRSWDQEQFPHFFDQTAVQEISIRQKFKETFKQKKIKIKNQRMEQILNEAKKIILGLIKIVCSILNREGQGKAIYQKMEKIWSNSLDLLSQKTVIQNINQLIQHTIEQGMNWELLKNKCIEIIEEVRKSKDYLRIQFILTLLFFTLEQISIKYFQINSDKKESSLFNFLLEALRHMKQLFYSPDTNLIFCLSQISHAEKNNKQDKEYYYSQFSIAVIKSFKAIAKIVSTFVTFVNGVSLSQDDEFRRELRHIITNFIKQHI